MGCGCKVEFFQHPKVDLVFLRISGGKDCRRRWQAIRVFGVHHSCEELLSDVSPVGMGRLIRGMKNEENVVVRGHELLFWGSFYLHQHQVQPTLERAPALFDREVHYHCIVEI